MRSKDFNKCINGEALLTHLNLPIEELLLQTENYAHCCIHSL